MSQLVETFEEAIERLQVARGQCHVDLQFQNIANIPNWPREAVLEKIEKDMLTLGATPDPRAGFDYRIPIEGDRGQSRFVIASVLQRLADFGLRGHAEPVPSVEEVFAR